MRKMMTAWWWSRSASKAEEEEEEEVEGTARGKPIGAIKCVWNACPPKARPRSTAAYHEYRRWHTHAPAATVYPSTQGCERANRSLICFAEVSLFKSIKTHHD